MTKVTTIGISIDDYVNMIIEGVENTAQDIADHIIFEADLNLRSGDFSPAVGKGATFTGMLADTGRVIQESEFKKAVVYGSNIVEYANIVDKGRPAGYPPPLEPMVKWVRRKFGYNDKKSEKVARAIVHTIGEKGTLPRPFFRWAILTITPSYIKKVLARNLR